LETGIAGTWLAMSAAKHCKWTTRMTWLAMSLPSVRSTVVKPNVALPVSFFHLPVFLEETHKPKGLKPILSKN